MLRRGAFSIIARPCASRMPLARFAPMAMPLATAMRFASVDVVIQSLGGESVREGKVSAVLVKAGDTVREDDVMFQIESDKSTVDVRATVSGIVTKLPAEGDTVTLGATVGAIDEQAVAAKAEAAPGAGAAAGAAPAAAAPAAAAPAPKKAEAKKPEPAAPIVAGARTERKVAISSMRQRVADRLKGSQNDNALLTTFQEVDMSALVAMRNKHKDEFAKKHGVKLGFMSPFLKASATALSEVPIINARWGDGTITYHDYVDISIAVATPKGLAVPVIRNVESMGLADIEKQIETFGAKAKENKITTDDMAGGTFTISNGGTFGSWMGTPIVNPPQAAILGMHAVKKKAWVTEKDTIEVRPIMALALTYDHRMIDGKDAVTFLVKLKNYIEDPTRMLLQL
jgi:2-oxoglutarate dehydrogenase E2 component (dihydrolipoamide succinyltransferase)